jgi:hypothetical protein
MTKCKMPVVLPRVQNNMRVAQPIVYKMTYAEVDLGSGLGLLARVNLALCGLLAFIEALAMEPKQPNVPPPAWLLEAAQLRRLHAGGPFLQFIPPAPCPPTYPQYPISLRGARAPHSVPRATGCEGVVVTWRQRYHQASQLRGRSPSR